MAGGPLQAADDMIRIITNGVTFGLADKAAAALGEKDSSAKTAAAMDRAGFVGDLANVGANLYGGGGALKYGWKGLTQLKHVVPVAKAVARHPMRTAGAVLTPLLALGQYNERTGGSAGQAKAAPAAPPKSSGGTRTTANADKMADSILASLKGVDRQSQSPTLDVLARDIAAAQGGLSIRQIAALASAANDATPRAAKPMSPRDEIMARMQAYNEGIHEQEIASGVPQAEADERLYGRYGDILKMDPFNQHERYNRDPEDPYQ